MTSSTEAWGAILPNSNKIGPSLSPRQSLNESGIVKHESTFSNVSNISSSVPPKIPRFLSRRNATSSIKNLMGIKDNPDYEIPMMWWEKLSIVLSLLSFTIVLILTVWSACVDAQSEYVSNDPTVDSKNNKPIQDLNKASQVLSYLKLVCNITTFSIIAFSFIERNSRIKSLKDKVDSVKQKLGSLTNKSTPVTPF